MLEKNIEIAISIRNLEKIYSRKKTKGAKYQALTNINLDIKKGIIFGLLGPNGAGKSTLINIIAGIVNKTSGNITVMGIDTDKDPRQAKYHLGVVPQEIVFDPFFTVREAIDINAGYYGITKDKRQTDKIIEAIGLTDKANTKPRSLSGGMKRRLLIGKALAHNPDIVILDEPTAGVDIELRNQLWEYVRQLNKRGITILLTTHYLKEAEELCDEIAVINKGKLIAHDTKVNLMKILDDKQIKITTKDIIKEIPQEFSELSCKIVNDNELVINYGEKGADINKIIEKINKSGLIISDIATKSPDLEDIFKHLVNQ